MGASCRLAWLDATPPEEVVAEWTLEGDPVGAPAVANHAPWFKYASGVRARMGSVSKWRAFQLTNWLAVVANRRTS